ncbi:MAG TPA: hypothetical protein VFO58_00110 [Vicinamibacterales bacterium]|nr:hypothetical protein [Vicinamibacterales bacterium]
MQESDLELEGWQRQWQSQPASIDLRQKVEAGNRAMRLGLMSEIAVTILMGGGSLLWAIVSERAEVLVLAVAVWGFITIAWTASILLRRGLWQPATSTTAAFLNVSILRCERSLEAIVVQAVLYVVILAFDLAWLYWYRQETDVWTFLTRPVVLIVVGIVTPILGAVALWYRGRVRRELENLRRLATSLPLP